MNEVKEQHKAMQRVKKKMQDRESDGKNERILRSRRIVKLIKQERKNLETTEMN